MFVCGFCFFLNSLLLITEGSVAVGKRDKMQDSTNARIHVRALASVLILTDLCLNCTAVLKISAIVIHCL